MSSSSTISSSLRLFTSQIPRSLFPPRTSSISASPRNPFKNPSFIKFISFQSIPTNQSSISASASASTSMHLQPIGELPPRLQEIVKLFQSVQEPKAKYQQLLFYGKNLKPLDAQFKTKQNKVEGCVSQVWVRAYLDSGRNVVYEADSDSALTKGLAALLVDGLSGRPVEEVLRVSPDFAILLGLQQSLTPSRNNGFLNMLKLMQNKALELLVEAENGSSSVQSSNLELDAEAGAQEEMNFKSETVGVGEFSNEGLSTKEVESAAMSTSESESKSGALGSRGNRIRERLEKELSPIELQVEDISYQHAGHAGVRGSNGETHFNVKVVSKEFEGKSLVKRHRLIYNLLQGELQNGLHALSIVAKTPGEVDRA